MDRAKWAAVGGFAYVLWTGFGLVGQLGGETGTVEVSSSNPNARSTLDGGIERINWDSGAAFLTLHGSSGSGRRNSALTDFLHRNNINTGSFRETESSLRSLAASLNPFSARADYDAARAEGASPEVVSHYQYLSELADAFASGRLPELIRKWFGVSTPA